MDTVFDVFARYAIPEDAIVFTRNGFFVKQEFLAKYDKQQPERQDSPRLLVYTCSDGDSVSFFG